MEIIGVTAISFLRSGLLKNPSEQGKIHGSRSNQFPPLSQQHSPGNRVVVEVVVVVVVIQLDYLAGMSKHVFVFLLSLLSHWRTSLCQCVYAQFSAPEIKYDNFRETNDWSNFNLFFPWTQFQMRTNKRNEICQWKLQLKNNRMHSLRMLTNFY